MSIIRSLFSCVSDRRQGHRRISSSRLKFGQPAGQVFGSGPLPPPLRDLLIHIARDGVAVCDLFRRPGNPVQMRKIIKCLAEGRPVDWSDYNFWTVANVAKKFLLAIPDGVFGKTGEATLLGALDVGAGGDSHEHRVRIMHGVIASQPLAVQQLLALLFGIWFRMIYHTDVNSMSVEAVAKSVAGSMFHSCTDDPRKVERASKVMELLISGFASEDLFGSELIEYFTSTTGTSINRSQLYAYEVSYPPSMSPISEAQFKNVMRDGLENYRGAAFDVTPTLITEYASLQPPMNPSLANANSNAVDRANPNSLFGPSDSLSVYSMQSDITAFQRTKPPLSPQLQQQQPSQQPPLPPAPPSISTLPMSVGIRRASEGQHQQQSKDTTAVADPAAFPQSVLHQRTPSGRFNSVKRRQLQQLARRTRWFMSSSAGDAGDLDDFESDEIDSFVDGGRALDSTASAAVVLERPLLHSFYSLPSAQEQQQQQQQQQQLAEPQVQQTPDLQQQQQQQPLCSSPALITERRYFLVNRNYGTDS
ncbi:hypothetical protein BOX15_Mlig013560g1 [Macrostomum lignano]|uniref:Rho-GAP domain-containing protein n=2 Tax=Macrostomum lignano TaxID=282301 RepID=A0A267GYX0_9PLAT|nr:hypothetical protein BOX15_Mlig013560g1 [Macrostomum lignano]